MPNHLMQASTLFAALLLLAPGCRPAPAAEPPQRPPVAVRTQRVRHGPMRAELRYVGTVQPRREVKVLARLAGTVRELPIPEGGWAKEGEVLARMTAADADARTARLDAEESRAASERDYHCERLKTDQRLAGTGAVTGAQLDTSRRACQGAEAAARAARAALAEARAVTGRQVERAPFEGRVLRHLTEPGQHVVPGQPLLLLGGELLEVRVAVAEEDLRKGLKLGRAARVWWGDEPARDTTITRVGSVAIGPGRTVEVALALPEQGFESATPGMSVDVAFVLAEAGEACAVPQRALGRAAEERFVYEVEGDLLRRRALRPTLFADGWVAVEPPLGKEAVVVVGELGGLSEGQRVYPVAEREGGR